jgi:predicted molibdopterin-dependent oxidoreductase YjgC
MTAARLPTSVKATVNGDTVTVAEGSSVLDACSAAGVEVPTLCYGSTITPANACRVCVVELEGSRTLVPACSRTVEDGMTVQTDTERAANSRRLVMELLDSAVELGRSSDQVGTWMKEAGVRSDFFGPPSPPTARTAPEPGHHEVVDASLAATVAEPVKIEDDLYVRDYARCILCYKCVDACGPEHQNTFAISVAGRGFDAHISTEFDVALPDSACVYCGNCIAVCPTGALVGKVEYDMRESDVWDESVQEVTRTVCSYCGVGCNLDLHTQGGRIVSVTSPHDHDVTLGNLCIKGRFGWSFVDSGRDG